jgi:predicted nucleic acid-binding protein
LCYRWAEVIQEADRAGRPIGVADAWMAATAKGLDCPLITDNPSDFAGVDGLKIITEAGAAP